MKGPKRGHGKYSVPRHRVLSPAGADAIERSIERKERQAAQKIIAQEVIAISMANGSAVEQHCAFIIEQCKRRGEPVPEYVGKALEMEAKKKHALKNLERKEAKP